LFTAIVAKEAPELRPFLAIAWSIALAPGAGFVNMNIGLIGQSAVAGFVSGSVASGNLKGGVQGAFSAALFAGIGQGIGDVSWANPGKMLGAMSAHALAGCVTSAVSGGDCGSGAASAAFSKAAAPFLPDAKAAMGEKALGAVTSAIIGGTASHLSGGKFANGATTGAFSYVMNQLAPKEPETRRIPTGTRTILVAGVNATAFYQGGLGRMGIDGTELQGFSVGASLAVNLADMQIAVQFEGAQLKGIGGYIGGEGKLGLQLSDAPISSGRSTASGVEGGVALGKVAAGGAAVQTGPDGVQVSTGAGRTGVGLGLYAAESKSWQTTFSTPSMWEVSDKVRNFFKSK
jgi:hypothetical protein